MSSVIKGLKCSCILASLTDAMKSRLTCGGSRGRGDLRQLSCMTTGYVFDVLRSVLTSFSAKGYNVNIIDRSQTEHFLLTNVDMLAFN